MRIIIKNLPTSITEEELKKYFSTYGTITDIFFHRKQDKFSGVCFVGFKTRQEANRAIKVRNKTYIRNRRIIVEQEGEYIRKAKKDLRKQVNNNDDDNYNNSDECDYNSASCSSEYFCTTNNIEIRNIPAVATESDVKKQFKKFGNITKIKFNSDPPKICCDISYSMSSEASKALRMNKKLFMGRKLVVFEKKASEYSDYLKSIFFDFKSVLNVSQIKEDEILADKNNLGTNISLLESHLIQKTKSFLESNGIFLDKIYDNEKNKKALIIRNFNLLDELNLKSACSVQIAPTKNLVIAYFNAELEADNVYRFYKNKRIDSHCIYVDYLPKSLDQPKEEKTLEFTNKLIVKNIPFQANKYELKKLFESQCKIKEIRLPMKNREQHRGFCFLIFENTKEAQRIYEYFGSNTHLYGRRLVIEISG